MGEYLFIVRKGIANNPDLPDRSVGGGTGPRPAQAGQRVASYDSYLVDPASSHMLVSKIKPCMSKYKHLYSETADGSLKQLWFI